MAALVMLVVVIVALATGPFMLNTASSLTPLPHKITVYELKLTDAQGQAGQSFTGSESVHLNMLARNYDSDLDAEAVMIVQVKGEDNIVYHLDWEQGSYPYAVEVKHTFEIPPLERPDQYHVTVHIWSNLDNPEVAGDSTGSSLRITP